MKNILRGIRGKYRTFNIQRQIAELGRNAGETGQALATAILSVFQNSPTSDEKAWIDKIEMLRQELSASTRTVPIIDYGAVAPGMKLTAQEMAAGRTENRIVGEICRVSSHPYLWGFLLLKLIREFKSTHCVEMGTSLGVSAAYQGAALNLNGRGRLVTIEGAPALAALAKENFQRLKLRTVEVVAGRFQDTLPSILRDLHPVDYVFVDGHHDGPATVGYFQQLCPFLASRAVLVFDDIGWSEGMRHAWAAITRDPRVKIAADLEAMGICVLDPAVQAKQEFRILID